MHNFNIHRDTHDIGGKTLTVETGRMAKQADGAIFLTYGDTSMLVTATAEKEPQEGTDFFPLTVDFIEKMYASGKIPGGFFKREAKPSTDATLMARLVDRAIRPLFPEGFRNAVHVVITITSYDDKSDPGTLAILGASLALGISDIPFNGPIAGIKVGMIDNELIINPDVDRKDISLLDLSVAGTAKTIVMIEAGASEITEEKTMEAIYFGHDFIKDLVKFQDHFIKKTGKEKREIKYDLVPEEISRHVETKFGKVIRKAAVIHGKQERNEAFDSHREAMLEELSSTESEDNYAEKEHYYKATFDDLIKKSVREAILKDNHRADGRSMDDIRPITCEIDVLPRVHGSALFTRGETQSLGAVTLGTGKDEQVIDGLAEEFKKQFFLHYNFPPFSVGEVGFMRGPGRRELGHGALAEKALLPVIPSWEKFPYTIRVVSEILESNGSSSMATVCSGTLALMAAGVPISKPVAGIANGLIMDGEKFVVLTDIMGLEDHLGDMDFKVTGTRDGITAIQMDIKIEGITREIMQVALEKAKIARLRILDEITSVIPQPRADISPTAPRIEFIQIATDKIGELIGPGGKNIKAIIETTGADIDIEDSGRVAIASPDKESIDRTMELIKQIVEDPSTDKIYDAVVSRVENYGAFVKIFGGIKEGLVHVSEMHYSRVRAPSDLVKVGDTVKVRFTGKENGKLNFSMKNIPGNPEPIRTPYQREEGDRETRPRYDNRSRSDRGSRPYDKRRSYNRDKYRDKEQGNRERYPKEDK
ncbi:MAG: polyribonucleotide nucleotidyltransferase [Candidatus Cloacimonetes bacterium]|nr:polyribonucleotide nucleotidyltransferase [Candidatus Cloacimonadota bacterium]